MQSFEENRKCYVLAQPRYTSKRYSQILYTETPERQCFIFYRDLNYTQRKIYGYFPQPYYSERSINLLWFDERYVSERDTYMYYIPRFTDDRFIDVPVGSVLQLQTSIIKLPFMKYLDIPCFLEGAYISQRFVEMKNIYPAKLEKYVWLQRNIKTQTNCSEIILPIKKYGEVSIYVNSTENFNDQRYCNYGFTADSWKYLYQEINRFKSINNTMVHMGIDTYSERKCFIPEIHYQSERYVYPMGKTLIINRTLSTQGYTIYNNERNIDVEIRRTLSINEEQVFWTIFKWDDRGIYMPWIIYNSERSGFYPIGSSKYIEKQLKSFHPLDIITSKDDLSKMISVWSNSQIDSIVIYDNEDKEYVVITEEDLIEPDKRSIKMKIDDIFDEKEIMKIHIEIFTKSGEQIAYSDKSYKLVFSGKVIGKKA